MKPTRKNLLCAAAVLALMLLGGFGTWWTASGASPQRPERTKPPGAAYTYIRLPELTLPVISARGVQHEVTLAIVLEVPAAFGNDAALKRRNLLDAYVSDLYAFVGDGNTILRGNAIDTDKIKDRLMAATAKVLGPGKAHDVLVEEPAHRELIPKASKPRAEDR